MEGETTVRGTVITMDQQLAGVMPDSWEGHARLAIRESEVIPQQKESEAIESALETAESVGVTPEVAATKLIEEVAARFD